MTTDITTGTTVAFGTSVWVLELTNLSIAGLERGSVDTSHLGTTIARSFIPTDLYDGGTFDLEGHYNSGADVNPPINGAIEEVTITWPDTRTTIFSAFMTNWSNDGPLEDKMTVSCTFKITGAVALSGASGSGSGA